MTKPHNGRGSHPLTVQSLSSYWRFTRLRAPALGAGRARRARQRAPLGLVSMGWRNRTGWRALSGPRLALSRFLRPHRARGRQTTSSAGFPDGDRAEFSAGA